ncbi:unnamed protein product [Haemonchus placei]|uniref:Hydrolase n=1 Tax=Haemonchus placei TaxID=6290 RepID=A0A0N4WUH8_HAEPC|nr:unnamed protein product [Haemonchus placei]
MRAPKGANEYGTPERSSKNEHINGCTHVSLYWPMPSQPIALHQWAER